MSLYEERTTIYFRINGKLCTDITLRAAIRRAKALGLTGLAVASTRGYTAKRAIALNHEERAGLQIFVVGEHCGYHEPGHQEMAPEVQKELVDAGVKLFFGSHLFSGVGRSFRLRWGGIEIAEVVAESFRRFSRGLKVGIECCIMLADAGLIPIDRDIVAVGGSGGGADSAVVVRPGHMNTFFDVKVREIIAMPSYRQKEEMLDILRRYVGGKKPEEIARETDLPFPLIEEYVRNFDVVREGLEKGATSKEMSLRIRKGLDSTRNYIELAQQLQTETVGKPSA